MVKVGLFVRLHAKPGKESELAKILEGGLPVIQEEGETPLWFAIRFDSKTFGIFDAFNAESGRQAHLTGRFAAALMAKAGELLAQPPNIFPDLLLTESRAPFDFASRSLYGFRQESPNSYRALHSCPRPESKSSGW